MLTEHEVIEQLRAAVRAAGSQQAYALQHSVSEQYVSDVLNRRRTLGRKILEILGLEKVVRYHPKTTDPGE